MKKALCLVLAGFMLLSGCQSDNNSTDEITISETTTQTEEQQQAMATTAPPQTTTSQTTTPKSEQTTTQETTVTTTETPTTTTTQTTPPQTSATTTKATTKPTETTTTKKEEKSEMPEIVFIEFKNTCLGWDNVIYGHYIDNNGAIRYFEFYDDTEKAVELKEKYDWWGYFLIFYYEKDYGVNLLKEKYDKIIEVSVETEYKIDKNKLNEMYNKLLIVDENSEIKEWDHTELSINPTMRHYYGMKNNKSICLFGGGLAGFEIVDENANVLYDELGSIFPTLETEYYPSLYK